MTHEDENQTFYLTFSRFEPKLKRVDNNIQIMLSNLWVLFSQLSNPKISTGNWIKPLILDLNITHPSNREF